MVELSLTDFNYPRYEASQIVLKMKKLIPHPIRQKVAKLRRELALRKLRRSVKFKLTSIGLGEFLSTSTSENFIKLPSQSGFQSDYMVIPLAEQVVLAALCASLSPSSIFEIGTYVGYSALLIAANTPSDAVINTLDLDPMNQKLGYEIGSYYKGTTLENKVKQLYGDSTTFDFSLYYGQMDFVFIDGAHTLQYVQSDSNHAFKMIKPGGVILWDDYVWTDEHMECSGVAQYLNAIDDKYKIFQITGTRYAIYRN